MWRASRIKPQGGFTLIEILVALAVFAIASLIAYRGLDAVASTKGALDREIRFWRELGMVFDRLDADLLQIAPHPLPDGPSTLAPPFRAASAGDNGFYIELARHDRERSPVRVLYRCERGELTLRLTPVNTLAVREEAGTAAAVPGTLPTQRLLHDIEHCDAAFLNAANAWLNSWPGDQTLLKPRAVRIRLTLRGLGRFERIYALP